MAGQEALTRRPAAGRGRRTRAVSRRRHHAAPGTKRGLHRGPANIFCQLCYIFAISQNTFVYFQIFLYIYSNVLVCLNILFHPYPYIFPVPLPTDLYPEERPGEGAVEPPGLEPEVDGGREPDCAAPGPVLEPGRPGLGRNAMGRITTLP